MAALSPRRAWIRATVAAAATGIFIMGFFLVIFPAKQISVPMGWDSSEYIWRTRLAQQVGVANIQAAVPPSHPTKSGRPAYPVVASQIASVTGVDQFTMAAVLPSVAAAAIGLASGAFVASTLRRPLWQLVVAALAVGTSAFMVHLMTPEGYLDNMLAAAVFMAAAIAFAATLEDRRALLPAVVLAGIGGAAHWTFFLFVAASVLLTAVFLLPRSLRERRTEGRALLDTPSARLSAIAGGGALLGAGTIFAVMGDQLPRPRVSLEEIAKKFRRDAGDYGFAVTLPLAAVGGASLARGEEGAPRRSGFVLPFLVAWCGVVGAGVLAYTVFGLPVPAHRFLAFGLAIPVLAVLGLLWLGRLAGRWRQGVGWGLVVLILGGGMVMSLLQWRRAGPWMDARKIEDARYATGYLERAAVADGRPVAFVTEPTDDLAYAGLVQHMIWAAIPPERIGETYLFLGSPEDYLGERSAGTRPSDVYLERLRPALAMRPVALIASSLNPGSYDDWVEEHPESEIVPGRVAVVNGPRPRPSLGTSDASVAQSLSPLALAATSAVALAILALAGLGWTRLLLGRWTNPGEVVAAAPAIGVAALLLGGLVAERIGVRLRGWVPIAVISIVSLAGWAASRVSLRRQQG